MRDFDKKNISYLRVTNLDHLSQIGPSQHSVLAENRYMHRNISDESEIYKEGDSEAITHSTRRKGRADLIVLYLQKLTTGKRGNVVDIK